MDPRPVTANDVPDGGRLGGIEWSVAARAVSDVVYLAASPDAIAKRILGEHTRVTDDALVPVAGQGAPANAG